MEKHTTTLPHSRCQPALSAPPPAYTPNASTQVPAPIDTEEDPEEGTTLHLNATTQIRGSGNIISMPPLDTSRLSSLLFSALNGSPLSRGAATNADGSPKDPPLEKRFGTVTISISCGAVVIGDRNIVGPGLADAARGMGVGRVGNGPGVGASAAQAQTQGQAKKDGEGNAQMPTPPESPRLGKRKAEDEPEDAPSSKKIEA